MSLLRRMSNSEAGSSANSMQETVFIPEVVREGEEGLAWQELFQKSNRQLPAAKPPATYRAGLLPVAASSYRYTAIERRIAAAQAVGREDAEAGINNNWSTARKPAAIRAIEAERSENLSFIRGTVGTAIAGAEAEASDEDRRRDSAVVALDEVRAQAEQAEVDLKGLPEARHGWLRLPGWVIGLASILVLGADVILTRLALENSLGNLFPWEAWTIAGLIGALLFVAGVGEGYIEDATEVAEYAGERPPFSPRARRVLTWVIVLPTALMLLGLMAGRWSLVDTSLRGVEWVAAIGSFLAISAAAVLVAVVAYIASRILLAARPRTAVMRRLKKGNKRAAHLQEEHLARARRADDAHARAEGIAPNYAGAFAACQEAWMEVIAAYWRGFALVRPEEAPDIDTINAITTGSRPLTLAEVSA